MEEKTSCNNKYEKIFQEIFENGIKGEKDNNITQILENISANDKLSDKEKDFIYDNIFEYVNKINKSFENKIEIIHKRGFEEGSLMTFILNKKDENNKVNQQLYLDIEEFILTRIKNNTSLDKNADIIKNTNDIENIRNNANEETLEQIRILDNLYDFRTDIKTVEAYKIGFSDSMKFFLDLFENKLNKNNY